MTTPTTVSVRLQLRADTAANWTSANPTLLANELGRETDTGKIKIGDGSTAWSSLAYQAWATLPIAVASGGTGQTSYTNGQLLIGNTTGNTLTKATLTAGSGIAVTNGTGSITVAASGISDAQIAADAEIAVSKLADGTARQLLQTDAAGTGVEWASNIDIPGTLDVTSTATFDSIASHPLGSAAAPTLTFTSDTNTGIYSPGADQVAISTAGSGRVFIGSTGTVNFTGAGTAGSTQAVSFNGSAPVNSLVIDSSGRLGVGTSAPADKLTVVGNSGAFTQAAFRINGTTGTVNDDSGLRLYANCNTGVTNWFIGANYSTANVLEITPSTVAGGGTYSTPALALTPAGRVGVGTTSPATALQVIGTARFGNGTAGTVSLTSDSNLSYYDSLNNAATAFQPGVFRGTELQFHTNTSGTTPTVKATIDGSGRVGIGTSSGSARCTIDRGTYADASATGSTTFTNAALALAAGTDTNNRLMFGIGSTGGAPWIQAQNTSSNATQSLILNPVGGNVGIGTTSPGAPLEVIGTAGTIAARATTGVSSQAIQIYNNGTDSYIDSTAYGAGSGGGIVFRRNGTGEMGRFDTSGRLLVGTSTAPTGSTAGSVTATNSIFTSGNVHGQYAGEGAIASTTGTAVFKFKTVNTGNNRACFVRLSVFGRGNSTTVSNSPAAEYAFQLHMTSANVMTLNGATSIFEYTFVRATHFAFANLGGGEGTVTITNPVAIALSVGYKIEILNAPAAGTFYLDSVTYA